MQEMVAGDLKQIGGEKVVLIQHNELKFFCSKECPLNV